MRHNKRLQGYLFSSSNFKDEEGGLKAIAEVLKFAYINNYYAILNYYKKHSDTYKEFIKDYTSGMVVESFIKKIIRE